jgi:hypothetical protein
MNLIRQSALRFLVVLLTCAATVLSHHVQSTSASPQSVATFSASDHSFGGPDTIPAGQTTIRLQNRGKEPHQLQLLKLDEGKSSADLAAALRQSAGVVPRWAKHMGGPNAIGSGEVSEATMYLEPGSYVIMCGIPTKKHQTHAALGMQKTLHVVENGPTYPDFYGNFHMAMFDYEFVVVQPLTKGRHTFYVINRGSQPHQASLVRLDPGASIQDVLTSFGMHRFPSRENWSAGSAGLNLAVTVPSPLNSFRAAMPSCASSPIPPHRLRMRPKAWS